MTKTRAARLAVAAIATPLLLVGTAGAASAVEITPLAEYVDSTVADTGSTLDGVIDALGLEADE